VAVARDGDLYLSEYSRAERVQRFSPDGKEVRFVIGHAGAGPGEFNRAEGLCVDAEDRLYVADSCNHRVQVFNPDGTFLRQFGRAGAAPGELSYPYDVRVDAAGHVFVCEFGNSRIQVFDAEGRSLEIIGGPGFAPGQFNNPWSLAMDSAGNLYVADATNHRVQKLIRRPRHASEIEREHTRPRVCRLAPPPIAPRARISRPPRSAAARPPQQPRTPSRPLKNPPPPRSAGFQPAVSPTSSRPSARIPRPPRSAEHALSPRNGIFPMVSAAFRPLPAPLAFRS
jgi:sugar lactone lactonase YvrE